MRISGTFRTVAVARGPGQRDAPWRRIGILSRHNARVRPFRVELEDCWEQLLTAYLAQAASPHRPTSIPSVHDTTDCRFDNFPP